MSGDQPREAPESAPTDEAATPSDPMGEAVLRQAFELWIEPEITRRREAGRIGDTFELVAAQIIMNADADQPEIRLNNEVRGVLQGRATRAIEKGQLVRMEDFTEYVDLELTEQDANAGHLSILRRPDHWWLKFDFRYNATRIAEVTAAAQEFLDVATTAREKGHYRALVDNLHSAVELLAKGVLLTVPDKQVLSSKSHGFISARYNLWGKLGNVPAQYVQLLNTLQRLRPNARYLDKTFSLDPIAAEEMLTTAQEMLAFVVARSPKRVPAPTASDLANSQHP